MGKLDGISSDLCEVKSIWFGGNTIKTTSSQSSGSTVEWHEAELKSCEQHVS